MGMDPTLILLIISVSLSVSLSAVCSLMEAVLYAVPIAHVKHRAKQGSKAAAILYRFKGEIGEPIAAILILNTIANTAGAAIAGAACSRLFGERGLLIFSILFTLLILLASEIVPKQLGVRFSKRLSSVIAFPLLFLIRVLFPLVFITKKLSTTLTKEVGDEPSISEEELLSMAELGTEEGVLDSIEGMIIKNIVELDKRHVRDIHTPRVVVFRAQQNKKISECRAALVSWEFSRVPLFDDKNPDHVTRYVTQRDIYRSIEKGDTEKTLFEISRALRAVPEVMSLDKLFLMLISKREHICAVINEHGGFSGLISLEDVIEQIVGEEIVDEYDSADDLRIYAKTINTNQADEEP